MNFLFQMALKFTIRSHTSARQIKEGGEERELRQQHLDHFRIWLPYAHLVARVLVKHEAYTRFTTQGQCSTVTLCLFTPLPEDNETRARS